MNKTIYKRFNLELVEENSEKYESIKINNKNIISTKIAAEINKVFKLNKKPEEHMILLCLDNNHYINAIFEVSHGDVASTSAPIANILKRALLVNSNRIIISHNHPSGNLEPSNEDIHFTKKLRNAAELLGIKLLDHIIIGRNNEYSSIVDDDNFDSFQYEEDGD